MSNEPDLFEPITEHTVDLYAINQLTSLRVLILEIVVNPLKFSVIQKGFPLLEQIYLDRSRLVCYCDMNEPISNRLPVQITDHISSRLDQFKCCTKVQRESAGRVIRNRVLRRVEDLYTKSCRKCMFALIKVL